MSSPLFLSGGLSNGVKGSILQTPDLELQKHWVHARRASVIVSFGFVDLRSLDLEESQAPPVDPAHLDRRECPATDNPERAKENVVGSDHLVLLPGGGP